MPKGRQSKSYNRLVWLLLKDVMKVKGIQCTRDAKGKTFATHIEEYNAQLSKLGSAIRVPSYTKRDTMEPFNISPGKLTAKALQYRNKSIDVYKQAIRLCMINVNEEFVNWFIEYDNQIQDAWTVDCAKVKHSRKQQQK